MSSKIKHLEPGRPARSGQLILERRHRIVVESIETKVWKRMLDVGCGNGAQTRYFETQDLDLVGLDSTMITSAEGAIASDEFRFVRGEALDLPFKDRSFDAVTCFEVLEHVSNDSDAVSEIHRTLKVGGAFIVTVPNKWWIFETHGGKVPGFNWIPWNRVPFFGWLPTDLHDRVAHARIYTLSRVNALIRNAKFKVIEYGYITAPLDVLPESRLRRMLRGHIFKNDTTSNPFLAVNLYLIALKQ